MDIDRSRSIPKKQILKFKKLWRGFIKSAIKNNKTIKGKINE